MIFASINLHPIRFSFESILMAIIASSLLIIVISICLSFEKIMLRFGYKLLILFISLTFLRFLFPLDFPISISVIIPEILSRFFQFILHPYRYVLGFPISIWMFIKIIWLIGSIVQFVKYLHSYMHSRRYIYLYGIDVTNKEPYKTILNQICLQHNKPNKFKIIQIAGIDAPVVYGIFSSSILIPAHYELTEEDLYYTLSHEAAHSFHHDLLIKLGISLMVIVYWWNPAVYRLKGQSDLLLEMRVDNFLTRDNTSIQNKYLTCLIHVSELAYADSSISKETTMPFVSSNSTDLTKRFKMICYSNKSNEHVSSTLILIVILCIYILSYIYIFEGYYYSDEIKIYANRTTKEYFLPLETTYLIDNGNGTYDVYFSNVDKPDYYLETVDSLDGFEHGITIYYLEKGKFKE